MNRKGPFQKKYKNQTACRAVKNLRWTLCLWMWLFRNYSTLLWRKSTVLNQTSSQSSCGSIPLSNLLSNMLHRLNFSIWMLVLYFLIFFEYDHDISVIHFTRLFWYSSKCPLQKCVSQYPQGRETLLDFSNTVEAHLLVSGENNGFRVVAYLLTTVLLFAVIAGYVLVVRENQILQAYQAPLRSTAGSYSSFLELSCSMTGRRYRREGTTGIGAARTGNVTI